MMNPIVIIICWIISIAALGNPSNHTGQIYLDTAIQTASWLISQEHVEDACDGLSWPVSDIETYRPPGPCNGAAGIGLFFLKLYQTMRDPVYLEKAIKAGNYIDYSHRRYMGGPDWFDGAASAGDYFIHLYKETHDPDDLEKAKYYAYWLFQNKKVEDGGYYWIRFRDAPERLYTGIAHGSATIGLFFCGIV